ncbi:MAG TPA: 16S rRNA (adenine(1518)-N(6)/adenine(1519)-N(6))-dimethyltransferase RsmA [Candidatus Saccharimonadales bacterium]|jgi:16S rRNA (adenine1518-N6/adenine1519-N6)-dimethyltransferase|nr:16S rRNA (adenine(1518)-N(6)/adenine(1519)-N(6))-dimethyltransferase RsmA [Candidatus Saccharimonadales bacterium]
MSSQTPHAKKSLGQHWLNDEASLEAMCQAAEVSKDDTVLEIGPGPGALTSKLVRQTGQVVAVEFDKRLAAELPARVPADNLQVVAEDILSFDLASLPPDYKVVANIPYYLTSNLVRAISETPNPPSLAAILVQKEVAQRVAANPGAMSLLSVTAQFYWHTELGRKVPAEFFTPPPKVDSQILVLRRRETPLFPEVDTKIFFRLAKAGFAQRRKTLLNSLSGGLRLDRQQAAQILEKSGIEPSRRAQTLSLQEWHRLYENLD